MPDEVILNGRYQLLDRVGSGGMATVFKARDNALGRVVAIKLMHESLTSDEGFLERFQMEAHAAANLSHPNIVTVHDIGQDGHRHYIVMEYVDGRTLKQIIREQNQGGRFLPINRTLDLIIQVCNGIGYAHRANLVHCDVKPQNILVTPDDRVKVADFGIAQAMSQASRPVANDSQVWGTPQYLAPEQAAGNPATPSTDVYSIGIVLFELLGGKTPFQGDTPTAIALKHLHARPPLVSQINPAVPSQLEHIILKVLAKEPAGRYRTAGQLGRILSTYRQSSLETTGPLGSLPDRLNPTVKSPPPGTPFSELRTKEHLKAEFEKYQPPSRPLPSPTIQSSRWPAPTNTTSPPDQVQTVYIPARKVTAKSDWTTIGLGIMAVISLLGLIPLWYYVYISWVGGG